MRPFISLLHPRRPPYGAMIMAVVTSLAIEGADLSGSIVSVDGKPIPGAELHLTGLGRHQSVRSASGRVVSRALPGAQPGRAAVKTRPDGSFAVKGLGDGVYLVCAEGPPPFLNPCDWARPAEFQVQADRVVGSASIRLESGVTLEIQIDDPGRVLPSKEDLVNGPPVSCGVISSSGAFIRAKLEQAGVGSRLYRMAIPAGQALRLSLSSRLARFFDTGGRALSFPHGSLNIPPQSAGSTHRIAITGLALTPAEKDQIKFR